MDSADGLYIRSVVTVIKVVRWGLHRFWVAGPTGPQAACGVSWATVALYQSQRLASSSQLITSALLAPYRCALTAACEWTE